MASDPEQPHWVDCPDEKHECFSYGEPVAISVQHEGRDLQVLVPDYLTDVNPLIMSLAGPVLFVLARQDQKWDGRHLGVVLVAKHRENDTYEVRIWHELYP